MKYLILFFLLLFSISSIAGEFSGGGGKPGGQADMKKLSTNNDK